VMTSLFIVASIPVLALGWLDPHQAHGAAPITHSANPALVAVILAFPVAMALATGTEAPATSIAQLGQLGNQGRRRFGRGTLAATIVIVGGLTMGLTALAVHLNVGIPPHDQTQISELARAATGSGDLYGLFQVTSGLLLLAAAASSFQAGPGLLKALARSGPHGEQGLLPRPLGRTNQHHTPVAAVAVYAAISAAILLAASGQEQELVLVYAVAVFVSFLAGLLAMARFSGRQGNKLLVATNLIGATGVAFTLAVNLGRGYPLLALAGTVLVAAVLYSRWARAGRPRGIETVERDAEAEDDVDAAPGPWPRVRLGSFALDQALARGADPSASRRLARRAEQLRGPTMRHEVAGDIERVVEAAGKPVPPVSAAVPLNRRAIAQLRPLLLTLAADLREAEPVSPRGVAIVRQLLLDGYSPLYGSTDPGELEEELRRARAGLLLA
jgi:Amino acid permease